MFAQARNEYVTAGRLLESRLQESRHVVSGEVQGERTFTIGPSVINVLEPSAEKQRELSDAQPARNNLMDSHFRARCGESGRIRHVLSEEVYGSIWNVLDNTLETLTVINAELFNGEDSLNNVRDCWIK